jgi:uncharacterized membrane protein (DUF4010 family)
VILIASIGFLNYVLLRLYSARGLYYSAVFGGLVNSTATIAELSVSVAAAGPNIRQLAIVINLLTIVSMFVRNLALLLIFSPPAGFIAAVPITLMALSAAAFIWWNGRAPVNSAALAIGSPVSLRQLVSFGTIFIIIQVAGSLGQRLLGESGAVIVSALGGLASSASSTAAVATLSKHGQIRPVIAAHFDGAGLCRKHACQFADRLSRDRRSRPGSEPVLHFSVNYHVRANLTRGLRCPETRVEMTPIGMWI